MSDEKGFYISVSTHLKGEAYDAFLKVVEAEAKAWVASDAGRRIVKDAVVAVVKDQVQRHFSWNFDKDPRAEKFKAIVTDAMFAELFRAVEGTAPSEGDPHVR